MHSHRLMTVPGPAGIAQHRYLICFSARTRCDALSLALKTTPYLRSVHQRDDTLYVPGEEGLETLFCRVARK